jgi:hypothetical protein
MRRLILTFLVIAVVMLGACVRIIPPGTSSPSTTPTPNPTPTPTPSPAMPVPTPRPDSTPTPTPTPPPTTPTPNPTPTPSSTTGLTLDIVSVVSPVGPGNNANLIAKTAPGAYCGITVYYEIGPSTALGLYSKTADSWGSVSWTWKVGAETPRGSWRIVVTSTLDQNTVSRTTYFIVQ